MAVNEIIGLIAACLTTSAMAPQAIKIIRTGDTQALSLSMYLCSTCGVLLWLIYGVSINDTALILANSLSFILAATILVLKVRALMQLGRAARDT